MSTTRTLLALIRNSFLGLQSPSSQVPASKVDTTARITGKYEHLFKLFERIIALLVILTVAVVSVFDASTRLRRTLEMCVVSRKSLILHGICIRRNY
jgi:hypothetical protein